MAQKTSKPTSTSKTMVVVAAAVLPLLDFFGTIWYMSRPGGGVFGSLFNFVAAARNFGIIGVIVTGIMLVYAYAHRETNKSIGVTVCWLMLLLFLGQATLFSHG